MKTKNLAQAIQKELKRAREYLKMYEEIPTGFFGATLIRQLIARTEKAVSDRDVVEELVCYKELEKIE